MTDAQALRAARLWYQGWDTQKIAEACSRAGNRHGGGAVETVRECEVYNRLGLIKEAAATLAKVSA